MRRRSWGFTLALIAGALTFGWTVQGAGERHSHLDRDHADMARLLADLPPLRVPEQIGTMLIKDHPQKTHYASADEWPFIDYQAHWQPSNAAGDLGHLHLGLRYPLYGIVTGAPLVIPFSVKLFHVDGTIYRGQISGQGVIGVAWDACGCSTLPAWIGVGDPDGLVEFTGVVLYDVTRLATTPPRGWIQKPELSIRITFTNGDRLTAFPRLSLYAGLDPLAPETGSGHPHLLELWSQLDSARSGALGNHIVRIHTPVPFSVPSAPWLLDMSGSMYGAVDTLAGTPPGVTELRLDPSLHDGVAGDLLASDATDGARIPYLLPPLGDVLPHSLLARWMKSTGAGTALVAPNERVDAIITIRMVAESTLPAPEVCGDGVDNDGDGLIDENFVPPAVSVSILDPFALTVRLFDAQGCRVDK